LVKIRNQVSGAALSGKNRLLSDIMIESDFYQQIYELVRKIPSGKVATYGQIAAILNKPRAARTVGYALNALRYGNVSPPVPWQRVINYKGRISLSPGNGYELQRDLLASENVFADENDVYELKKYLWREQTKYDG
jgi:methylated-DNA-protein-cysteine methyltransferase related protein